MDQAVEIVGAVVLAIALVAQLILYKRWGLYDFGYRWGYRFGAWICRHVLRVEIGPSDRG